ncbi:MAG: class B sortase, partial [Lachnospiraceae bacterium]|nr:class B sortase [Lachnospiraceae bacterium]
MRNKKRLILLFMRTVLLLIVIVCLIEIGQTYYLSMKHKKEQTTLKNTLKTPEITVECEEPEIMEKFEKLYAENNDLIGWLSIPEMVIDYPVMQNGDDEYYLHHNFYGEDDKYGCLFVKNFADVDTPDTNFIIYGHNMKDGAMFGDLDKYKEEAFYRDHPLIYFDTLYEERTYEIMAVFLSQVYENNDDVFKYYEFYQADTDDEFLYFYEAITDMSLYETGVTAEFGDTFLMLSTCDYH